MTKKWYKSRTMWTNLLVVAGGVFTAVAAELQTGATITAIGLLNIVLRFVTKTPIK